MITREEIADTFERRFHHFGFRKTSMDEVAHELRISKKTIYTYFESKDEIFRYLVGRASGRLLLQFSGGLADLPNDRARLEALIRLILREALRFGIERDPLDFHYEIAEEAFRDAYRSTLRNLIAEGTRSGEFAEMNVDIIVPLSDGLIASGLRLSIAHPDQNESNAEITAATISAIMKIIS
jgi:AcrR family transcriptional regulator